MSSQQKSWMLRCIAAQPRTLVFFTDGTDILPMYAPRQIEVCAQQMIDDGLLIFGDGVYYATELGRRENAKVPTKAEPRVHCGASMKPGSYVGPKWNIRPGGEAHKQFQSLGTGT